MQEVPMTFQADQTDFLDDQADFQDEEVDPPESHPDLGTKLDSSKVKMAKL